MPPKRKDDGDVILQQNRSLGRVAIAGRNFAAGEVVLRDVPFLVIDEAALGNAQVDSLKAAAAAGQAAKEPLTNAAIAVAHRLQPNFFDAAEAATASLTAPQLRELISSLYSPLAHDPTDKQAWLSEVLRPMRDEVEACVAALGPGKGLLGAQPVIRDVFMEGKAPPLAGQSREAAALKLLRFLHAVRVNTHGDEKKKKLGVYLVASKFTHSCSPNTFWHLEQDEKEGKDIGLAVHVACRPIAAGELLTFSYLGTGWNMLRHTAERRSMLAPLNFTCGCDRCAAFDAGKETSRTLPCPSCAAGPREERRRAEKTLALVPGKSWRCSACHMTPVYDDLAFVLGDESHAVNIVLDTFFRTRPGRPDAIIPKTAEELSTKFALLTRVLNSMGKEHYVFAVSLCGFLRCLIHYLSRTSTADAGGSSPTNNDKDETSVVDTQALVRACVGGIIWFDVNMKGSPQQLRFATLLCEALLLLKQHVVDAEHVSAAFRKDSADTLGALVEGLLAKQRPIIAPFARWAECAPIILTHAQVCPA
jgi:hypothetical protein